MTLTAPPPTDSEARTRIRTDLDRTLFVEAGAGTGKTTALVGRVAELVISGRVRTPAALAAITFTEAAAAELRDRVRCRLEDERERIDLGGDERLRVDAFLAELDDATITTLHGFASRLLAEYPLDAGLPPGFEVEDPVEASVRFERRWGDLIDDLHDDPAMVPVLERALVLGLRLRDLADVARAFDDNWDRLGADRHGAAPLPPVDVAELLAALDDALERRDACTDPGDRLAQHLDEVVAPLRSELRGLADADPVLLLGVVGRVEGLKAGKAGKQERWGGSKPEVTDALDRADAARQALVDGHRREVLERLVDRLRAFALAGAEDRRRRGQVSYHDLLVRARDLLRSDTGARVALAGRYERLLIDEFQDTDPLQLEIAALLAARDPAAEPGPWDEIPTVPGKLFLVGDPKQSIYRFRRADIALYAEAQEAFGADVVRLTENFRSVPDVLAWVNGVFGTLIVPDDQGAQPEYVDLDPHRIGRDGPPAVITLGGPVDDGSIGDVRDAEAREIAALIRRMRAERWAVVTSDGGARPLRYDDVAILVPTRTPLSHLERALEREEVPYRVESRSLVFRTDEVRELLAVLAAVDDPADEVALVAALRSPGFACSDDDLVRWRMAAGHWRLDGEVPAALGSDHPVARGLADLAELHRARDSMPVDDLVGEVVRRRRLVELTLGRRRPRDHWRRYRFVVDTARAFVEAGGTSLAEFVTWARLQSESDADVLETVVPEPDDDAVRVMTVHGSKGLEFPVVLLAGLNTEGDNRRRPVAWGAAGVEVRLGGKGRYFGTGGYDEVRAVDLHHDDAEQRRLLYVAATRAKDHLVVSLFHKAGGRSHAALLHAQCEACAGLSSGIGDAEPRLPFSDALPELAPVEAPDAADRWRAEREALLARANRPEAERPSALGHGFDPEPIEADDERRVPGRGKGGTARGIAVHAVLQSVTLPGAGDLDGLAARHAEQEGVGDRAGEVAAIARAALASAVVQRAVAATRRWRELALVVPVGDRLIEGFVDLAFEDADGRLVIVDYKTDVEVAPDRYRRQVAAYALALARATGREVGEGWLVFAGPDGVVDVAVDDLPVAMAEVEALVAG